MNIFTKEWINTIPKIINENGCWIPIKWQTYSSGYIVVRIDNIRYSLHRIVMCVYNNINYDDPKINSRHSKNCDKACFNHEHLTPGTFSDNTKDSVEHGTHRQTQKKICPKCGNEYKIKITKSGWNRGRISRRCTVCDAVKNAKRYQ